jgi:predicted PurR-regulated permease PerM
MIRGRLWRRHPREGSAEATDEYIEIDPRELSGMFTAPQWLRDLGIVAWLIVGVALMLVGLVWLLGLTQVIVAPVITAAVVAAVASPLVRRLHAHRVPRAIGAVLVLLGIIAIGFAMFVLIVVGITGELGSIHGHLNDAKDTIAGWAKDIGMDPSRADAAKDHASSTTTDSGKALLGGVLDTVEVLSGLVFYLALTALSLFFLLKDGPQIRRFAESHLGVPMPVAQTVSQRMLQSLRGYFLGVTIVASFSSVVVAIGATILGVPLIGTIVAVTFIGGFIPYLGAWSAAGFSVLIALGGAGPDAAAGMIVVQLLANGILQQLVQPFAMGAALGIHPLAVLIVTIAGGALFGAVGLILAAPLTSAITRISADLARARAETEAEGDEPPPAAAARAAPA